MLLNNEWFEAQQIDKYSSAAWLLKYLDRDSDEVLGELLLGLEPSHAWHHKYKNKLFNAHFLIARLLTPLEYCRLALQIIYQQATNNDEVKLAITDMLTCLNKYDINLFHKWHGLTRHKIDEITNAVNATLKIPDHSPLYTYELIRSFYVEDQFIVEARQYVRQK